MIITMLGVRVGAGAVWQPASAARIASAIERIFMRTIALAGMAPRQRLRCSREAHCMGKVTHRGGSLELRCTVNMSRGPIGSWCLRL